MSFLSRGKENYWYLQTLELVSCLFGFTIFALSEVFNKLINPFV